MKSIVVGIGKVGSILVENLIKEKHDVTIIDILANKVENYINKFDIQGVVGTGAERDIMLKAGVSDCDFFVACTSRDDFNILVCVMAKKLGAKKVIARVRDPRYFREVENIKKDLGIDMLFNPEYRTALEIAKILRFPSALSIESFAGGKASMVEFEIESCDPIIGKNVATIVKEFNAKVLFGMIVRDGEVFIPNGEFVILEGDTIHIIGSDSDITAFSKKLHIYKPHAKDVFIIGGGRVAYYLADVIIKEGVNVKIIEENMETCEELSSTLSSAKILNGDGTDAEVLDEENIHSADACITLTNSDEENVIVSLYAQSKGVKKVITKVNSPLLNKMVDKLGLDTVVSPGLVIANHVIRFVRAHREEESTGMKRLYMFGDGADAIEFVVKDSFKCLSTAIKDMKIKKNVIIGGIIRDGKFILPKGDSTIEIGDRVVIVTKKSMVNDLNDTIN